MFEKYRTKWTTVFKIIVSGEEINIVASKRRSCRLEFGGLYYSKNSKEKLQLIRNLIHAISKEE